MGVGVYDSDFNGTGGCILIDGPLGTDQDYEEHCKARRADGEEPVDRESWSQNEYGDIIEIGWRSWEHDFVIGVGGAGRFATWMQDPDGYVEEIVAEMGMSPKRAGDVYGNLSSAVQEYVRIRLMQDGFRCRYKTSGYTSSAYAVPDDASARLEELKASIKELSAVLMGNPGASLKAASSADRIELAKSLKEINDNYGRDGKDAAEIRTAVAVYNAEDKTILFGNPYEEIGWIGVSMPPTEMREYLGTLETDENHLAVLPRNEMTEAWFAERQAKCPTWLILTTDEYLTAVGEDLVVRSQDEDESVIEYTVAVHQPSPRSPALV